MRRSSLASLVLFSALIATLGAPRGRGQAPTAARGPQSYEEFCAVCHGADGNGNGGKAPPLVSSRRIGNRTDAELFQAIHDGTAAGMPPFAQIGAANITALVRYLRALAGPAVPAASAASAGDASAGRALFFGPAQCSRCHMVNGAGGFIASNLTAYARNRTAAAIAQAITQPDNPLAPASRVVTVTTSTGATLTGVLRNEDAFNLQLQTEDGRFHFFARADLKAVRYTDHSLMPRDYAARLAPQQLLDLAGFLIAAARSAPAAEPAQ